MGNLHNISAVVAARGSTAGAGAGTGAPSRELILSSRRSARMRRRGRANREGGHDSQRASWAGAGAEGVDAGGGGDATRAGGQLASACSGSATIVARLHLGVHLDIFSADWPLLDGLVEWPDGGLPGCLADTSVASRALRHLATSRCAIAKSRIIVLYVDWALGLGSFCLMATTYSWCFDDGAVNGQ